MKNISRIPGLPALILLLGLPVLSIANQTEMPQGLWQALSKSRHQIEPNNNDYQAFNPGNSQRYQFTADGLTVRSSQKDNDWQFGLRLSGIGSPEQLQAIEPATITADGQRIEYRRGNITEWYENKSIGLEQGFTVQQRPQGKSDTLVVSMTIEGALQPRWQAAGQSLSFVDRFGLDPEEVARSIKDIMVQQDEMCCEATDMPQSHSIAETTAAAEWNDPEEDIELQLQLHIADKFVSLSVADSMLARCIEPIVQHLQINRATSDDHVLHLRGAMDRWILEYNGSECCTGTGRDEALVHTVLELVELGCRGEDRLLVVHGAGLVCEGKGALLIGSGGSGKTTLAAAMNAEGFGLLGDDVIPVLSDGKLLGIGMSLCIKSGSWPVLSSHFEAFNKLLSLKRAGQSVRFLPPKAPLSIKTVPIGMFLFPNYHPGATPTTEPLSPEAVLQRIVESDSLFFKLDPQRLDTLVRWIGSAPAYALQYPDLETGVQLCKQLLTGVTEPARSTTNRAG